MVEERTRRRHTFWHKSLASVLLLVLLLCAPGWTQEEAVRPAEAVPWRVSPDGKARVKTLQTGEHASMGLLQFQAGAHVPPHNHPDSDEMLYLETGRGTMTVNGKTYQVRAGDAVRIPAGAEHSFTATSEGQALQVYTPPGPEVRFQQWPEQTP